MKLTYLGTTMLLFDETKWGTGVLGSPEDSIREVRTYCESKGIRFRRFAGKNNWIWESDMV